VNDTAEILRRTLLCYPSTVNKDMATEETFSWEAPEGYLHASVLNVIHSPGVNSALLH
jgi:hypothetical protein